MPHSRVTLCLSWQVIVDADTWVQHLPNTILAVFVKRTFHEEDWGVEEEGEESMQKVWARKHFSDSVKYCIEVHSAFLREFGLTAAAVPLLEYDPIGWVRAGTPSNDETLPFRDISPVSTWGNTLEVDE